MAVRLMFQELYHFEDEMSSQVVGNGAFVCGYIVSTHIGLKPDHSLAFHCFTLLEPVRTAVEWLKTVIWQSRRLRFQHQHNTL